MLEHQTFPLRLLELPIDHASIGPEKVKFHSKKTTFVRPTSRYINWEKLRFLFSFFGETGAHQTTSHRWRVKNFFGKKKRFVNLRDKFWFIDSLIN